MMTASPTVSVVLPVHRVGPDVRRCLEAIVAAYPAPLEFIVVVDGADPKVMELARPYASHLISLNRRGGPARARNVGAAAAVGDVLLFIDADVVVGHDIIDRVRDYLQDHPNVAALIGSYDDEPGAHNFLSQYKNLLNHFVHQRSAREGYTFWGACGAIRRETFQNLGGFDESYAEPSVEDIELGYRLLAAGDRVHVLPELQVKHLKRWNARSLIHTDIVRRAVPWSELIVSAGGFHNDLNIDRAGRIKVVAVASLGLGLIGGGHRAGRVLAAASVVALLAMDAPLLRFYAAKRGPAFAACTVPWSWLSYAYSGGAFAFVVARGALRDHKN